MKCPLPPPPPPPLAACPTMTKLSRGNLKSAAMPARSCRRRVRKEGWRGAGVFIVLADEELTELRPLFSLSAVPSAFAPPPFRSFSRSAETIARRPAIASEGGGLLEPFFFFAAFVFLLVAVAMVAVVAAVVGSPLCCCCCLEVHVVAEGDATAFAVAPFPLPFCCCCWDFDPSPSESPPTFFSASLSPLSLPRPPSPAPVPPLRRKNDSVEAPDGAAREMIEVESSARVKRHESACSPLPLPPFPFPPPPPREEEACKEEEDGNTPTTFLVLFFRLPLALTRWRSAPFKPPSATTTAALSSEGPPPAAL